jgi:hypothetical protein
MAANCTLPDANRETTLRIQRLLLDGNACTTRSSNLGFETVLQEESSTSNAPNNGCGNASCCTKGRWRACAGEAIGGRKEGGSERERGREMAMAIGGPTLARAQQRRSTRLPPESCPRSSLLCLAHFFHRHTRSLQTFHPGRPFVHLQCHGRRRWASLNCSTTVVPVL